MKEDFGIGIAFNLVIGLIEFPDDGFLLRMVAYFIEFACKINLSGLYFSRLGVFKGS